MKQGRIVLSCYIFAACFLPRGPRLDALDLMLRSGQVLHHVCIVGVQGNGVRIRADQYGNGSCIISRTLRYSELPLFSRMKLEQALNRRALILSGGLPSSSFSGGTIPHNPDFYRQGIHVRFDSSGMLPGGSFGWAHEFDPSNFFSTYPVGRVYVRGISIPQGGNWFGIIYPAGRGIALYNDFYECWALSPQDAEKIGLSAFPL